MNNHIIDIKDLTDSRELLEAKPPKVMTIFIYYLLLMIAVGVIWSYYGSLEIVIKAPGIIRPAGNISSIRNIIEGPVKKISFKNGDVVDKGDLLYQIDSKAFDIEQGEVLSRIAVLKKEKKNLVLLKEGIQKEENLFPSEEARFYNRFLVYVYNRERLNLSYLTADKKYEIQKNMSGYVTSRNELEELESAARLSYLNLESYISENRMQVEMELQTVSDQLSVLFNNKKTLEEKIDLCSVTASIGGQIQRITDFNTSDYLLSGVEVLRILPGDVLSRKVEILVSNKDIAGIEIGDSLSYRFPALPQNEYGIINGEVLSIPVDTNGSSLEGVYIIEGSLNKKALNNGSGKSISIKTGMFVDVRIIVRKRKILFYLLDKLDLISKKS